MTAVLVGLAASSAAFNRQSPPLEREQTPVPSGINGDSEPLTAELREQAELGNDPPTLISCTDDELEAPRGSDLLRENTVIGTVVDDMVDRTLDERDRACIRALLDHQDNGQPVVWKSAEAGISFSMVPIRSFRSGGGLLCREFYAASLNRDVPISVARHVACRQLSGDWLVRK